MKRPKSLEAGKKAFFRHRNDFGEVIVCVDEYEEKDRTIQIGVAFCNPRDFNLRRNVRAVKGYSIAAHRASLAPAGVGGSRVLVLPDTIVHIGEEVLPEIFEECIIKYLCNNSVYAERFGFSPYQGEGKGEFLKWIGPFCAELWSESCIE